jgi:hypothetical protein
MSAFQLTKWYLDCTSEAGEVFIAYCARLRWGALRLEYSSVLECRGGQPARVAASVRSTPAPTLASGVLDWSHEALGVRGCWTSLAAPLGRTFFQGDQASVVWTCHQPLARASLTTPRGALVGLGYTECLCVEGLPWQLPIDALAWGRFVSPDASLVWVDWRGSHRVRAVFLDGVEVADASVDEAGVDAGDARLRFEHAQVLRRGALGSTVLSGLPQLASLLPLRMLATDETKWTARGVLERVGRAPVEGRVIYEMVQWPRR